MPEDSCFISFFLKYLPVIASFASIYIAYSVFKFNHDAHVKQTINIFIQRCNDATKDDGLSATRESLGTVITSCCKACEYIEELKQPLFFIHLREPEKKYKQELMGYLWNLLPFYVWEELIFHKKYKEFCNKDLSVEEDKLVLRNQYDYLMRKLRKQMGKHGKPPI